MRRCSRRLSAAALQCYAPHPPESVYALVTRAFGSVPAATHSARWPAHTLGSPTLGSPRTRQARPLCTAHTPRAAAATSTMASEGDESKLRELYPPNEPYNTGEPRYPAPPGIPGTV